MTRTREVVEPRFDHLARLTDERGLFEHAEYDVPRPEHGYCVDDAARALVVTCRSEDAAVRTLTRRYLDFTLAAVSVTGACRNRMAVDGRWTDRPALGDWWGRATWAFGLASVHAADPQVRADARRGFRRTARRRSTHPRAMVFAALGAGEVLLANRNDGLARSLVRDAVAVAGRADDASWPWPFPRLTYANGAVPEALLLAGQALEDPRLIEDGLVLLDFLLRSETHDGHLSFTPVAGRGHGESRPAYDQQPLEAAALADACARAYDITGAERWRDGVRRSWAWFEGDNDARTPLVDRRTGGCCDGLQLTGANRNQGAESTLAALAVAQQAQRLTVTG